MTISKRITLFSLVLLTTTIMRIKHQTTLIAITGLCILSSLGSVSGAPCVPTAYPRLEFGTDLPDTMDDDDIIVHGWISTVTKTLDKDHMKKFFALASVNPQMRYGGVIRGLQTVWGKKLKEKVITFDFKRDYPISRFGRNRNKAWDKIEPKPGAWVMVVLSHKPDGSFVIRKVFENLKWDIWQHRKAVKFAMRIKNQASDAKLGKELVKVIADPKSITLTRGVCFRRLLKYPWRVRSKVVTSAVDAIPQKIIKNYELSAVDAFHVLVNLIERTAKKDAPRELAKQDKRLALFCDNITSPKGRYNVACMYKMRLASSDRSVSKDSALAKAFMGWRDDPNSSRELVFVLRQMFPITEG